MPAYADRALPSLSLFLCCFRQAERKRRAMAIMKKNSERHLAKYGKPKSKRFDAAQPVHQNAE